MGIARGVAKAAKAAKKQTRGLQGNRNSQGDFMTGENKLDTDRFAGSEMMARDKMSDSPIEADVQNYIDDVKAQIDEIEAQQAELAARDTNVDSPETTPDEWDGIALDLENQKITLLQGLIKKLEDEGIEVPEEIYIKLETTG